MELDRLTIRSEGATIVVETSADGLTLLVKERVEAATGAESG